VLDCVSAPQPGDPFIIPKPAETYARLIGQSPKPLRVGIVLDELAGVAVDPEVAAAVEATARTLPGGPRRSNARVDMGGMKTRAANDLFRVRRAPHKLRRRANTGSAPTP
jgi:Asp-tRNA(Asn)/Glu-tRNA(Gln) amidotransferase A subunit family amidase